MLLCQSLQILTQKSFRILLDDSPNAWQLTVEIAYPRNRVRQSGFTNPSHPYEPQHRSFRPSRLYPIKPKPAFYHMPLLLTYGHSKRHSIFKMAKREHILRRRKSATFFSTSCTTGPLLQSHRRSNISLTRARKDSRLPIFGRPTCRAGLSILLFGNKIHHRFTPTLGVVPQIEIVV